MLDASPIWTDHLDMGGWPDAGAIGYDLLVLCSIEGLAMLGYPSERQTARMYGCETLHAPFYDGPVSQEVSEQAERASAVVARAVRGGDRVLVTCFEGRNRSGLVVALALLRLFPAMSPDAVIRLIKNRRWAPSGYSALTNQDFVDYIRRWRSIGHGRLA